MKKVPKLNYGKKVRMACLKSHQGSPFEEPVKTNLLKKKIWNPKCWF